MVDNSYNQFVHIERRQLDREGVEIADGSVFTGQQAMALGLVDTLGGYEDAVAYLASAAGISGEPRRIKQKEEEHSILDILGGAAGEYLALTEKYMRPAAAFIYLGESVPIFEFICSQCKTEFEVFVTTMVS